MERAYDERTVLYFYRKNRASAILLLVLGFATGSIGLNRKGSYVFLMIGIAFVIMSLWLWVRQRFIHIKGEEVDRSVCRHMSEESVRKKALEKFDLDEEDLDDLQGLVLRGYTPLGIDTEPIFRWDTDDGTARSSNYQMTYFIMDKEIMFTYSQVRSLVDPESFDGGRVWRFNAIRSSEIGTVSKMCMTAPGRVENQAEGFFNMLFITDENNGSFGFAFAEDDRGAAEYIDGYINKMLKLTGGIRKPSKGAAAETEKKTLSRRERRALEIGPIGGEIKEI